MVMLVMYTQIKGLSTRVDITDNENNPSAMQTVQKRISMPNPSTITTLTVYLKNQITNNIWCDGERLPPTRDLAKQLHTDTHTLGQAFKILADDQLITIVPRKGIFIGARYRFPSSLKKNRVPAHHSRWKRLRMQLENDIFSGVFTQHDQLPQNSILQKRYNASYPTIRKACENLEHEGVLIAKSNRYHIARRTGQTATAAILSISTARSESVSLYDDFITAGMSALELACSRNNTLLKKKGADTNNGGKAILDYLSQDRCFGYILWAWPEGNDVELERELLLRLAQTGRPVAIVDEYDSLSLSSKLPEKHRLKIFSAAKVLAGQKIGRHLINQGHRRCAYISCWHEHAWSQNRLRGAIESFDNAGIANGVTPFVCDTVRSDDIRESPEQGAFVKLAQREFLRLFPAAHYWANTQIGSILHNIKTNQYVAGQVLWKQLFVEALRDESITAWICANDSLAAIAVRFLKMTQSPDVNNRIRLAGFDDLPIATELNITSYNFAPAAIIEKAVGYIIYQNQEYYRDKVQIECEGLLIERESTGSAPG